MRRLPSIVERRRALAERYGALFELQGVPVTVQNQPSWARSNWQSFAVWLPEGCDQRQVMQAMLDAGIATRRGIMNAHREPPYRDRACSLPVSETAQDRIILLPLFPSLTDEGPGTGGRRTGGGARLRVTHQMFSRSTA